ncbi:MAG: anthranilate synthase component I [Candidatus Humimicrobiaceae bacterium]
MFNLNEKQYKKLRNKYSLIPLCREYMVDTETPASLFLKIKKSRNNIFLLESIEGLKGLSRYSIIGVDFSHAIEFSSGTFCIEEKGGNKHITQTREPLKSLKEFMDNISVYKDSSLSHFVGGAVGYLSYDLVNYFESIPLPQASPKYPEMLFYLTETIVVFDHFLNIMKIISTASRGSPEASYEASADNIQRLEDIIFNTRNISNGKNIISADRAPKVEGFESNFTRNNFISSVKKAKKYITSGDTFQIVLSQKFSINTDIDPFSIYRGLRTTNPSPYMYFLDFGEFKIIGSSPEPLIKIKDGHVLTCPIAGTRKRGENDEEDKALVEDLLADKKEKAEHNMLVDLARNDLGRVCSYGSVKLKSYMDIEKYSHVIHLVSRVEGKLSKDRSIYDALMSVFPAGTLTGAPKVRAMQIISELEPERRGPYGGAVGYFGYDGSLDSCITIRTAIMNSNKIYIQAGAGIVFDSVAEHEYQETINKANALFKAITLAKGGENVTRNNR